MTSNSESQTDGQENENAEPSASLLSRFRKPAYGVFAALSFAFVALAAVGFAAPGAFRLPVWPLETTGKIYVESPEVYTRERLVNDRYNQDYWLRTQLDLLDGDTQLFGETRSEKVQIAIGGASAGGDEPPPTDKATPTFQTEFALRAAMRDKIRQLILENLLDDRHDLTGNSVYGLKFDTAVIPGANTHASAKVEVTLSYDSVANNQTVADIFSNILGSGNGRSAGFFQTAPRNFGHWINNVESRLNDYIVSSMEACSSAPSLIRNTGAEPLVMKAVGGSEGGDFVDAAFVRQRSIGAVAVNKILGIHDRHLKTLSTSADAVRGFVETRSAPPPLFQTLIPPEPWGNYFFIQLTSLDECQQRPQIELLEVSSIITIVDPLELQVSKVARWAIEQKQIMDEIGAKFRHVTVYPEDRAEIERLSGIVTKRAVDWSAFLNRHQDGLKSLTPFLRPDKPFFTNVLPAETELSAKLNQGGADASAVPVSQVDPDSNPPADDAQISAASTSLEEKLDADHKAISRSSAEITALKRTLKDRYSAVQVAEIEMRPFERRYFQFGRGVTAPKRPDPDQARAGGGNGQSKTGDGSRDSRAGVTYVLAVSNDKDSYISAETYEAIRPRFQIDAHVMTELVARAESRLRCLDTVPGGCLLWGASAYVPAGLVNFAHTISRHDAYAYAAFPKQDVEGLLTASARAAGVDGRGASIGAGSTRARAETAPTLTGFADGEDNERKITFGWVIEADGPAKSLQKSQLVLVSVPAYLSELNLAVKTSWLDRNGDPIGSVEAKPMTVALPPDFDALDTLVNSAAHRRAPSIYDEQIKAPIIARACRRNEIVIPGARLWRSATVTLGGLPAQKITVLPNMQGILATFEPLPPTPTSYRKLSDDIGAIAPTLAGSEEEVVEVDLKIWTSEGVAALANSFAAFKEDDPARNGRAFMIVPKSGNCAAK